MHVSESRTCMDASSKPATGRKILVFEQDDFLSSLLHLLLHREGFEVSIIKHVQSALEYIEHGSAPDLLFINHMWLLDDSPELLHFKQITHDWHQVPVIVMSHFFHENRMQQLNELGVNDVVIQPFEPNDLLDLIQKYTTSG